MTKATTRSRAESIRRAALCGAPVGLPVQPEIGTPAGEMGPLIAALALLVGAAVWMFRRFGSSPGPETAAGAGAGRTPSTGAAGAEGGASHPGALPVGA